MTTSIPHEEMRRMASRAMEILGLEADLVGVRLLGPDAEYPAGAAAFGFRPLPDALRSGTAVLQATCVDSTIIPLTEKQLNFGYGCYGCRDATDLAGAETAIGFPAVMLADIMRYLEYLGQKAIPASRSKKAFAALVKRSG
jgi:uncharacterized protein (DUF169 family)